LRDNFERTINTAIKFRANAKRERDVLIAENRALKSELAEYNYPPGSPTLYMSPPVKRRGIAATQLEEDSSE